MAESFIKRQGLGERHVAMVGDFEKMTMPKGTKPTLSGKESDKLSAEKAVQKSDVLGQSLRRIYKDVVEEPVPPSIADILKKLE